MSQKARILVVEDQLEQRNLLQAILSEAGYPVLCVSSAKEALLAIEKESGGGFQLVISDLTMPEMTGIELIKAAKPKQPGLEFIVVTANGTIESAIEAIKVGAADYLLKPVEVDDLLLKIERVIALSRAQAKVETLERENQNLRGVTRPVGTSKPMRELLAELEKVARTDASILFTGETGVGKEVFARYVHELSARSKAPFVAVNCSAIPENLMESEFFGFEKGAFTGADRRGIGLFEKAAHGTLFLDELGELDLKLQPKILRAIEERKIRRVSGNSDIPVDIRFLAATNRDLKELVASKQFRDDLYYRLGVVTIRIPPLRERKEDLPALVEHLVKRHSARLKIRVYRIDPAYVETLQYYSFPGNVRELSNIVERSLIYQTGGELLASTLPSDLGEAGRLGPATSSTLAPAVSGDQTLAALLAEYERKILEQRIQRCCGDKDRAAASLQVARSTFYAKIAKHGLK